MLAYSFLALLTLAAAAPASPSAVPSITRVKPAAHCPESWPNIHFTRPSVSGDGRFVAFESATPDLVPGDTNDARDIFVYDRQSRQLSRVSVSSTGAQGNGDSFSPSMSADGRFVAFSSVADNFAPDDTNFNIDVFVHDRLTGQTTLESRENGPPYAVANGGSHSPSISRDGGYLAFVSDAHFRFHGPISASQNVFVRERHSPGVGNVYLISRGVGGAASNGWSIAPSISPSGFHVAFESLANNLVSGDTNGVRDVFVGDSFASSPVWRASASSSGAQADGESRAPTMTTVSVPEFANVVAFQSNATNLVPADTNGVADVFVRNSATGQTSRISVDSAGAQANGVSTSPTISADGRLVAFSSSASNLVPGDTNGFTDIFVHDRNTGQNSRQNVSFLGAEANNISSNPRMSTDGRVVVFQSLATNLWPGDTNGVQDIFARDRQGGAVPFLPHAMRPISELPEGASDLALSNDADVVAFTTPSANCLGFPTPTTVPQIFALERSRNTHTLISATPSGGLPNAPSDNPSVTPDGRYVVFESEASDLVPGDTNAESDIFLHDRQTGQVTRVSIASSGAQANAGSFGPSISADGRFVAFNSPASNLVPNDTNLQQDVFVHDRQTGQTTRVSVSSSGAQANFVSFVSAISADGRSVAFASLASNLVPADTNVNVDVFVHDRQTGQTSRVSAASGGAQANAASWNPAISADGRFVAFESLADNLVPADLNNVSDVFVHDRLTGLTTRASLASNGAEPDHHSILPVISADGRFIAFQSEATNLVPGDDNGAADIFVRDLAIDTTTLASWNTTGSPGNEHSFTPAISPDGRYVGFASDATDLDPSDTNAARDVFVFDQGPLAQLPCPGDANGDRAVDFLDLNIVLSFFGQSVTPGTSGDLNNDGAVDFLDLNIVLSFFGSTC